MGCQYYDPCQDGGKSFTVAMPRLTFGRGCLSELGARVSARGLKRIALITDPILKDGELHRGVASDLTAHSIDHELFSDIIIEPTDACAEDCAAFLKAGNFDGVVSLGGGSVIDTAKAALVVLAQGGPLQRFFAPPMGEGIEITGPVLPHIACPTTSGTGSECTSVSVIRLREFNTKFVIGSPHLLPVDAIVDPACLDDRPEMAMASAGFDLLCHALECYTAVPYSRHKVINDTPARQLIQGANPWSEMVAVKALQIADEFLVRGVTDKSDKTARDQLMWGASLAGIAFGNSGTHLPHALSYGITHLMSDISTKDYEVEAPFIPHGVSVALTAPVSFRYTAEASGDRHFEAAQFLGCDLSGASSSDSGEALYTRITGLMKDTGMPNGLSSVGFSADQVSALAESSARQKRAITNAPRETNLVDIENIYRDAIELW